MLLGTSLAGSCGSSNSATERAEQTATTETRRSQNPRAELEQVVLEAYRKATDAFNDATEVADPDLPSLAATTTGEALTEARRFIAGLRANGLVARGTLEVQPTVLSVGGNTAVVRAVGCDRGFKYDARTGELRDSPRVVRFEEEATLALEGGTWKVAKIVGRETGTCAT